MHSYSADPLSVDLHFMDVTEVWIVYGRIVDELSPDAQEPEIIEAMDAVLGGRPTSVDGALVEAAKMAIDQVRSAVVA